MDLGDIWILLSRPQEAGNVGAVCRAMKTMGFTRLLVEGRDRASFDDATVRARCVHAEDVWDAAEFAPDLRTALSSFNFAAGTTRRRGVKRKRFSVESALFAPDFWARVGGRGGKAAIVFGNERTGLTDGELALCDAAVHIPVSPDFPSLNLSHAVQVVCYDLFRTRPGRRAEGYEPIGHAELDALTVGIAEELRKLGFFKVTESEGPRVRFREILARAGLSEGEAKEIGKLFRKVRGMAETAQAKIRRETGRLL